MNKQEAIEKIKKQSTQAYDDFAIMRDTAIHIVNQIDEHQKVVVPKFVAEWIECCKHDKFYALHGAYAGMDDRLKCWRFRGDNSELFAKAWIYGYEIEKDKRYTVEIADAILTKIIRGCGIEYKMLEVKNAYFTSYDLQKNAIHTTILTEEEIKEADERLWQFAKEIGEKK